MYNLDIIAVSVCMVGISPVFPINVSLFISCLGVIGLIYGLWGAFTENEERGHLVVSSTH
jgi:hypothetical protein